MRGLNIQAIHAGDNFNNLKTQLTAYHFHATPFHLIDFAQLFQLHLSAQDQYASRWPSRGRPPVATLDSQDHTY